MDYMFQPGFLGTRAPFFMDFFVIIVALLPFMVAIAIFFAKKKNYYAHAKTHIFLFTVAIISVAYFEYGVRVGGGYEDFSRASSVSQHYLFYVLIFHIIVAVVGLIIWAHTISSAKDDRKRKALPGLYSVAHKRAGKRTFVGIVLTSITGIWVYILLFVV